MTQDAIETGLAEARAELEELRARQLRVEALISRGEAALGLGDREERREAVGRMTLHSALELVLRENANRWMTVRELSDEVNRRGLYTKRDGSPVEPNQVHARTKNYGAVFDKDGSRVRLRATADEWDVMLFDDDDAAFHGWLDDHPHGFFVNAERRPKPTYLVLHVSSCPHFDRSPTVRWTKDYIKICSDRRDELEGWAEQRVGGDVTLCTSCFG